MKTIYLVVEGSSDVAILTRLLTAPNGMQLKFFVAEGFSNALSMVKTICDLRPFSKIILIIDNDILRGHYESIFNAQLNAQIYSRVDSRLFHLFEMSPNIELELFNETKSRMQILREMQEHSTELRQKPIIKKIQTFIDAPTDSNEEEDLVLPRKH